MTSNRWLLLLIVLVAALLLISCSKQPTQPATQTTTASTASQPVKKEPVLSTGHDALEKMQGYAQKQWSSDAVPVHLESETTSEANGKDGKATIWRAVFISPSRQMARHYVWSGSVLKDSPPLGVTAKMAEIPIAPEMSGNGFPTFLLKTDSDKAFAIAQEHGGGKLMQKFPEQPVNYIVELDHTKNAPVWLVIYGTDMQNKKGYGAIHGMTGAFIKGGS